METEYIPLLLALAAGLFYACSAVLCKKALELGAGTIRSLVYSNIFMSMCFLPYPLLAGETIQFHDMQTGACLGLLFFLGQFFCFLALKNGEASLITPIMGSKPIFVAAFIVLHGLSEGEVSWETWVACGLSALAVALLCWPSKNSTLSWTGLFLALATAATFGLLDSLVPFFTHQSNPVNVLFFIFGSVGLFSLFLIPYTEGNFLKFRKKADRWMWASAIPMGGQAILMSMAIGLYHVPTEANIFYACRGLWAVLLIAWFGKKMMLSESSLSTSTFMRRGLGASLLIIGIWLTSFQ